MRFLLIALSLCADCFAVSLCSAVSLKSARWRPILLIALAFAFIQAGLYMLGWAFGYAFVGLIQTVSHIIGFVLLLYVGGSMLLEGIKGESQGKNLNGWRNILLGGVATSIDASAVGVSMSMSGLAAPDSAALCACVFGVTALSVCAGISIGKALGCSKRLGRVVEIVGGVVLIGIGVSILV